MLSDGSSIIVFVLVLTGGRGVGIVFSANFFSMGKLRQLGPEGHGALLYRVLDLRSPVRTFGGAWP